MNKQELLEIISEALEKGVSESVSMDNEEEWDSLAHLTILSEIDEKTNGASSEIEGIAQCRSFSDFCDLLEKNKLLQ